MRLRIMIPMLTLFLAACGSGTQPTPVAVTVPTGIATHAALSPSEVAVTDAATEAAPTSQPTIVADTPTASPPATASPAAEPTAAPANPCIAYHTVQSSERLFRIAQQYGVDWRKIARVNNIADPSLIYAGQVLCIPAVSASTAVPLPTTIAPPTTSPPASAQPPAATSDGIPHIASFTVDRTQVNLGASVIVSWKTTGKAAQLCRDNVRSVLCLPVSTEGRQEFIMHFARRDDDSLPFTLMAFPNSDFSGQPATATLSVTVRCPAQWFFANPPDECAKSSVLESRAAAQPFEHGAMIWLEATQTIFVLLDQPQQGYPYTEVADPWKPGMPESDPTIVPPAGFYQPVRGFGVLWRGEADDWPATIRQDLGWATAPEAEYTGAFQCNAG